MLVKIIRDCDARPVDLGAALGSVGALLGASVVSALAGAVGAWALMRRAKPRATAFRPLEDEAQELELSEAKGVGDMGGIEL